jgi:hypothetical protein
MYVLYNSIRSPLVSRKVSGGPQKLQIYLQVISYQSSFLPLEDLELTQCTVWSPRHEPCLFRARIRKKTNTFSCFDLLNAEYGIALVARRLDDCMYIYSRQASCVNENQFSNVTSKGLFSLFFKLCNAFSYRVMESQAKCFPRRVRQCFCLHLILCTLGTKVESEGWASNYSRKQTGCNRCTRNTAVK